MRWLNLPFDSIADKLSSPKEQVEGELTKLERTIGQYKYPSVVALKLLHYVDFIKITFSREAIACMDREVEALLAKL